VRRWLGRLGDGPLGHVLRVDALGFSPAAGRRLALAVGVAGIVPVLLGRTDLAGTAAIGALLTGVVTMLSPRSVRVVATVAAAAALAAAATLGSLVAGALVPRLLVVSVAGYSVGRLASRGPPVATIALQGSAALLTLGAIDAALAVAPGGRPAVALAVAGGGLVQLVALVLDPARGRYLEHRRAVALGYRRLAQHLDAVVTGPAPGAVPGRPQALAATLGVAAPTARDAGPSARALSLAVEAERIRAVLFRLDALSPVGVGLPLVAGQRLTGASHRLRALADELSGRPRSRARPGHRATGTPRGRAVAVGPPGSTAPALTAVLDRLDERLDAAETIAAHPGDAPTPPAAPSAPAVPSIARSERARGLTRTGTGTGTGTRTRTRTRTRTGPAPATTAHAIRLALALAVATLLAAVLPLDHGYWLPFTTLLILRPDYAATSQRALGRTVGTVAGSVLALALVAADPPLTVLLVVAVAAAWVSFSCFDVSFALFTFGITVVVSVVLDAGRMLDGSTIGQRVLTTVLGVGVALVAIRLAPVRVSQSIGPTVAAAVRAEGVFAATVLRAAAAVVDPDEVLPVLQRARAARLAAVEAMTRTSAEPRGWRGRWWTPAWSAVRATRTMADAGLQLWSLGVLTDASGALRSALVDLAGSLESVSGDLSDRLGSGEAAAVAGVSDLTDNLDAASSAAAEVTAGVVEPDGVAGQVFVGAVDQAARVVDALGIVADATADLVGLGSPGR